VVDAPGQKPLPAGQRVAESIPLEASRPATPAPDARPARELSAPVVPTDKSSQGSPLLGDQRVTQLEPFVAPAPIPPIGGSTSAHEVTAPGSSLTSQAPGPLPPAGQQTAALRPFSAITGAPLHDQGPVRPERIERIVRYIEQYDGGSCFFVAPVELNETKARLEGYGASPRPFEALNTAFQHENGFEATIDVRIVAAPQCPAVTFLGRLRGVSAPHLRIDSASLSRSAGNSLTGAVDSFGTSNIVLLLATDSGAVQNVSHLLKSGTDAQTFALGLADIGKASTGQPQLLIAVATSQSLDALRFDRPVAAERLFPALLSEAARTNQAVAAMARYFKLEP
jgi:eukaryotic-like serine/threonine-protein kinase